MKTLSCCIPMLIVVVLLGCTSEAEKLTRKALALGRNAELPTGWAQYVGFKTEEPVPTKRLQVEKDGTTNRLDVAQDGSKTVVLFEMVPEGEKRKHTFYVTDGTWNLKRAEVNFGPGTGWVPVDLQVAAAGFERQTRFWVSWLASTESGWKLVPPEFE